MGLTIKRFTAPWCGPCKMMAPVIEEIKQEYSDITFVDVNVDEDAEGQAQAYGVQSVPTLLFILDGEEQARLTGFQPKMALEEKIQKYR